jgi:hypothetical protein
MEATITFSPLDTYLIVQYGSQMTIIDTINYSILNTTTLVTDDSGPLSNAAFISDTEFLTVIGKSIVKIDVTNPRNIIERIEIPTLYNHARWSPNGKFFIADRIINVDKTHSTNSGDIITETANIEVSYLINGSTGEIIRSLPYGYCYGYIWSPNSQYIAITRFNSVDKFQILNVLNNETITLPVEMKLVGSSSVLIDWSLDSTSLVAHFDSFDTGGSNLLIKWNLHSSETKILELSSHEYIRGYFNGRILVWLEPSTVVFPFIMSNLIGTHEQDSMLIIDIDRTNNDKYNFWVFLHGLQLPGILGLILTYLVYKEYTRFRPNTSDQVTENRT